MGRARMWIRNAIAAAGPRWRDERGAVGAEHGLIMLLVVLVLIGALTTIGLAIAGFFDATAMEFPEGG